MTDTPQWNPSTISKSAVAVAPKNEEFFNKRQGDVVQALVREGTQNALDAILKGLLGSVRMSFRFVEVDGHDFAETYLAGLEPHLDEVFPDRCRDRSLPVRCLVVEDFRTTGLTGGTDAEADSDGNFVKFWLRYGESNKGNHSGGRHGLGKSTIASASEIRTFFGVTKRADDGRTILYGQSTLKPHRLGGSGPQYDTYPLFSVLDADGERNPVEGAFAERLVRDFGLRREESGLSLVIPFVHPSATEDMIVAALVTHCFPQICAGSLEVEVGDREVSQHTIEAIATERPELVNLLPILRLGHAAYGGAVERFSPVADSAADGDLRPASFGDADYARMQELWADGKMVEVAFDLDIAHRTRGTDRGRVRVFMQRHDDRETAREVFVRGRVTVIDRRPKAPSYVAVLVAEEGAVSKFLGDSENPAHDDWSANRAKSYGYLNADALMRRVKGAVQCVHGILSGADDGRRLKDALTDILYVTDASRRPKPIEAGAQPAVKVEAVARPVPVLWDAYDDGAILFHRCRTVGGPVNFSVHLAYEARKGKAKHSPLDFDLTRPDAKVSVRGKGTITKRPDGIDVRDADEAFRLTVGGFDRARQVSVRIVAEGFETGEAA